MCSYIFFFFFNDTATTEIYTLSLHDALPIFGLNEQPALLRSREQGLGVDRLEVSAGGALDVDARPRRWRPGAGQRRLERDAARSEEHTSELQSRQYLVCRLLLEKKK